MKIVLSPNPFRDRGLKTAQSAARILNNAGVETKICLPFSTEGTDIKLAKHIECSDMHTELPSANILICFGGDGTILHAAKDAIAYGIPILGVNLGSVGFMAEVEQSELSALQAGGGKVHRAVPDDAERGGPPGGKDRFFRSGAE